MGLVIHRFDIYLVNLEPTIGSEMKKTRPCVVVSPNSINRNLATVLIAPMTSKFHAYPSHVPCFFQDQHGEIALEQMRVADKRRLIRLLGTLDAPTQKQVLGVLAEMFAE